MKKVLLVFIVSILTMITASIAYAVEVPNDIRVGLFYSSSAKSSVTLSSPGGIEVGTINNGVFTLGFKVKANEQIVVRKNPNSKYGVFVGEFNVAIGSADNYPYFKSLEKDGVSLIVVDGKKYRGNIEIKRLSDSDMTIINHLSMQEYLYGVVPREIGGASPLEAVKAQAIIARTYAAKNMGRRDGLGFDLYPTATDQAYGGYEWEHDNSNKAVDLTYGEVATYKGELIGGNYFSTSGGYTEDSENVWGGKVDYLRAVPDTYEPEVEGNTSWETTMTKEQVKASLSKNGINVGDIVDLVPIEYTDAGRVLKLKIVGTAGEKIIEKDKVRTYLGLKSMWYTINDAAPTVKGTSNVPTPSNSTNNNEKEIPDKISIVVDENVDDTEEEEKEVSLNVVKNESESNDSKELIILVDENGKKIITKGDNGQAIIIEDNTVQQTETKETKKDERTAEELEKKTLLQGILSIINTGLFTTPKLNVVAPEYKSYASSTKEVFTFRGRGWGHAVGMSQNGAKGMANNGFSAEEIIKWYYSGVSIEG